MYKNILSKDFTGKLKEATAGFIDPENFKLLVSDFESEIKNHPFTSSSEANLIRIIFSLYDKISFLQDCIRYPHYIQILTALVSNSNYLTDVIVRNPELLYWLISEDTLKQRLTENSIKKFIDDSVSKFKTFNSKVNNLRLIKRRELLRIGINDILGNTDLKETTRQLAILAKGLNASLFLLCHKEVEQKYKLNIKTEKYCIIALGKLGGDELNYSSDIDLILFYDKNSQVSKNPSHVYYEILREATQLYAQTSTAITDKGYLFRVDFRLRPDGRTSLISRTVKEYLQYYETRGEDWERQMLIKMSFVGGNQKLYKEFFDYIQHFVYPSSFSTSPLAQIARIKNDIEKKVKDKENIKLFSGGIRDIEFSVQALQLLNGGKIPSLRSTNTLVAIDLLVQHKFLSSDESAILKSSYEFYRKIEHYLQLMNDQQTHVIPDNQELLLKLSLYLNLKTIENFKRKIDSTRKQVRNIYESIIGADESEDRVSVESINFKDKKRALDNFKYLQTGQGLLEQKQFDKQTIDSFKKIEDRFVAQLEKSYSPDSMLENFTHVIKTYSLPSVIFNELTDEVLLNSFLKLCESCRKGIEMMLTDKSLTDMLLSRKAFLETFDESESISFKTLIFYLSVQFRLGIINNERLTSILSLWIKSKISQVCANLKLEYNYFVAGMGSFATGEMTFGSDLDLIFAVEDLISHPEAQEDFTIVLANIKKEVPGFEVDCRLRPEGKNSPLVWDTNSYYEYLVKRAQFWEYQAFTRMNLIYGSEQLFKPFLQKLSEGMKKFTADQLKQNIIQMRQKIDKQLNASPQAQFGKFFNVKKSRGGLIDIEYAVQFLMMQNPELFMSNAGKSIPLILDELKTTKIISSDTDRLKNNYSFLKELELNMQIILNTTAKIIPLDENKRYQLIRGTGFTDMKEFETILLNTIRTNRTFFDEIIK